MLSTILDNIKKYTPLNLDLMSNPVNWLIIGLMVAIASVGLQFVMKSSQVSTPEQKT